MAHYYAMAKFQRDRDDPLYTPDGRLLSALQFAVTKPVPIDGNRFVGVGNKWGS